MDTGDTREHLPKCNKYFAIFITFQVSQTAKLPQPNILQLHFNEPTKELQMR